MDTIHYFDPGAGHCKLSVPPVDPKPSEPDTPQPTVPSDPAPTKPSDPQPTKPTDVVAPE